MSKNIANIIKQLASAGQTATILVCEVKAVDKDARTVDVEPLNDDAPVLGVNLQANQEAKVGVVQFPRVGSYVAVAMLTGYAAGVVVLTEDIESVEVVISDSTSRLTIDEDGARLYVDKHTSAEFGKDGIVLNGGDLGGLVKIQEIKDNLDTLKQYCEALKNATSAGITAVGAAMSANGATGAKAFDAAMSSRSIVFKDMENDKIKQ